MSVLISIADAVTAALNAATLSQPLEAVRAYVPLLERENMGTLQALVIPTGLVLATITRAPTHIHDYRVEVCIEQSVSRDDGVGTASIAALDERMTLVQEIADLFRGQQLASTPPAWCIAIENVPVFSPRHVDEQRGFFSVVALTYRLIR